MPYASPAYTRALLPAALLLTLALTLAACGLPGASSTPSASAANTARGGASASITYVAVGASDAFGIGTDDPDRQNWPTVLAGDLGGNIHLINLGIPGETVAEAQQNEAPIAIDAKPKIITVWLAVNDFLDGVSLDTYSQRFQQLITTLRQRTQAQIFVGNIPDLTQLPRFYGDNPVTLSAQVQQWNAAIVAACDQPNVHLVDLFNGWGAEIANHPEYISSDGFHPSTIGAARLAQVFAAAIRPYLKS